MSRALRGAVPLACALAVLATPATATATAKTARPPAQGPLAAHRGFLIGFSLGAGAVVVSCDGCESPGGMSVDASIGGFLHPRLALMVDVFAVIVADRTQGAASSVACVALQYWITRRVWIKGGAGMASVVAGNPLATRSVSAFGVTAAAGLDFARSGSFTLDVQARVSDGAFDGGGLTNLAVLVGAHWY